MKLRYFLTSIFACLALAIGCTQEELPGLSDIQVTPSYFNFGVEGGSKEVTVKTDLEWTVTGMPEWVSVAPAKGTGEGKFTVTAVASTDTLARTAYLKVNAGEESHLVTVKQDAFVPEFPAFKAGEYWIMTSDRKSVVFPIDDGGNGYGYMNVEKTIDGLSTAKNVYTFAAVEGEENGFTIVDTKGQYHIGSTYNSFTVSTTNPKDGSEVWYVKQVKENEFNITNKKNGWTIYMSTYGNFCPYPAGHAKVEPENNLPCLVNAAEAGPAEIKFAVEPTSVELEKEAGEFEINMTCKNDGFEINPSDSWVALKGMTSTEGEYVVTFSYEANEGGARTATIDFVSGEETITVEVAQAGSILAATVAEFLAAEEGTALYRVQGVVKSVSVSAQYHNANVTITGGAGEELYLYRLVASEGNIEDVNFGVGDLITVVGARSSYGGSPQMAQGGVLETVQTFAPKTVAEFIAAEEGDDVYAVTGEIVGIKDLSESYNNVGITIKDGDSEILLYRVKTFDGTNVVNVGLEVGGTVTVAGKRSSYNGTPQMAAGGILLSYNAPVAGETATYTKIDRTADLTAGTYYMAGYLTTYENQGTVYDWAANPYHVCSSVGTDIVTGCYSFAEGVLTKKADDANVATDVVLEAVEGKTATFYVKIKGAYLYSSEYNNRKLATSETKVEWVATNNANGGITLTTTLSEGTISLGTAGATSKMIRSYKNESTLKYGLVFFKKN